jgi:hypothetical protein
VHLAHLRLAESAGRHLSLQVEPAIIEPTRTSDLMNQLIRIQIEPNADLRAAPQSLGFGGTWSRGIGRYATALNRSKRTARRDRA